MFLLLVDRLLDSLVHFYFAIFSFTLLYLLNRKDAARNLALLLCSGMVVNYILKQIFQIPLPEAVPIKFTAAEWLAIRAVNYSMPSAHANHLFILFFVYIFEFNVILDRSRYKILGVILGCLCFTKCITIYILGFHFPEDILVGFLLAGLECILYYRFFIFNIKRKLSFTLILLLLCIVCIHGFAGVKKDINFSYRFVVIFGCGLIFLGDFLNKFDFYKSLYKK